MKFSFRIILLAVLLVSVACIAAEPTKAGKFDDNPVVTPQIDSKNLVLPSLWDQKLLPQYRLRAAHYVVKQARQMALNNLASQIEDIRVDDKLLLSDMFKKSDEPTIKMNYFLRGVRENGLRYRKDCLAVEVELEISLKAILGSVKGWLETHLSDKDKDLVLKLRDKIEAIRGGKLRAMGIASVNMEYIRPEYRPVQQKLENLLKAVPTWISRIVRVQGEVPFDPNDDTEASRDQAFREAGFDARQKLRGIADGLPVTSKCTLKQFVSQDAGIAKEYNSLIMAASVVDKSEIVIGDKAETTVAMTMKKLWNLYLYYRLKGVGLPKVKPAATPVKKQPAKAGE